MSIMMLIILILALVEKFSVDGQSTFGPCEANGLNFADEMQSKILDEIKDLQYRERVSSNRCTQFEDRFERHLNNITHTLTSFDNRLGRLDQNVQNAVSASTDKDGRGFITWSRDCADIRKLGQNVNDVYQVSALGPGSVPVAISVYCDMKSSNVSWLVFQRRKDGSVNFERTWIEYRYGFGNLRGEFWLGNDALHILTSNKNYKLRIELEDFEGIKRFAEYAQFVVGSASDNYRLNISGYTGNAEDRMAFHNGQMFSTIDEDHDDRQGYSCAQKYRGAWWYKHCHDANLNGRYLGKNSSYDDGINWAWSQKQHYSLKNVEMKIAPRE